MANEVIRIGQPGEAFTGPEEGEFGDVLIVGGGISGIQAALDMSSAGFKVYLVEEGPSIGGHMAQLDKTFPTNDCSM
jgi:heterodisulfide reductase subunit A